MVQLPRTPEEQDERYNPANELYHREFDAGTKRSDPYADSGIDQAEAYANDPGNAVAEREQAAGEDTPGQANPMNYQSGTKKTIERIRSKPGAAGSISKVRKFGPIGVALFFIVAGALITTASLPGLVLQHIEETITGALNDADPALHVRTKLAFKMKADAVRNGFAESADGKCNIKCKFGTVNEKMKTRMEADSTNMKVDLKEIFPGSKRYVIKRMEFPDGTVVTNGNDFINAVKDTGRASAFYRIFNPGTDPFLSNNFIGMLQRIGLSKKATLTSDDPKENEEQLTRDLGEDEGTGNNDGVQQGGSDEDKLAAGDSKLSQGIESAKAKLGGLDKASNIAGVACTAYDAGKATELAYSAAKIAKAATLFSLIAKTASMARVGNLTPAVATQVGDMITQTDNDKTYHGEANPYYGQSFTDAASYHMDAYGDTPKLSARDQALGLAPAGVTGVISQLTNFLNSNKQTGPAVLSATHTTCAYVGSPLATFVSCLPESLAGSVAPGVGNAAVLLGCAVVQTAIGYVASQALGVLIPNVIKLIVANDLGAVTAATVGPALANSVHIGGAYTLGSEAGMYGMTPGTANQVKTYKSDTVAERQSDIAVKQYDAASTPFDASNQYSFLGSAIRQLGLLDMNNSSLAGAGSWLAGVIPRASLAVLPASFAATDLQAKQAANYSDDCPDPSLTGIGVACDGFGVVSYTMSNSEMNADVADNTQQMINLGAIDPDSGEPVDGAGPGAAGDYANFVQYCANRTAGYGKMSGSITDDDYAWDSGYLCGCNEQKIDQVACTANLASELHTFRTYTMDKSLFDAQDDDPLPGQTDGDGTVNGGTTAVDASSIPNTCSNQTQTGAGITAFSGLSGGSFSSKVNSAPNGNLVSFAAGTFSFSNFNDHGGRVGADITQPGLLGAGVGNTVLTMAAGSSTKKGVVPSKDWTTNPLYLMRVSKDNTKLDCFTLKGTDQGHLYNGLRIDHASGVQLSNLQFDGVSPGHANFPPGETFAINDWGGNGNVYKNVELNGENEDAAAFGTNSTTGGTWINSSAHDFKYSHGWAMWQQKGGATLENCQSLNNWNGVNLERVSGTVTLKNMTFGGNHTDIAGGDDQNDNLKLVIIDPVLKGHSKITIGWWPKEMGKPNKWGKDNVKVIVKGVDKTSSMIDWKATGAN